MCVCVCVCVCVLQTIDMEALCMTLAEVASAMAYLHAHRITHRDLKPKNVLLKSASKDRRGFSAKVSDFGLSQVLPDTNRTQVRLLSMAAPSMTTLFTGGHIKAAHAYGAMRHTVRE